MQNFVQVKIPSREVLDNAKVRIGAMSPTLPATRSMPTAVADGAKVRIGAMSPGLPKVR